MNQWIKDADAAVQAVDDARNHWPNTCTAIAQAVQVFVRWPALWTGGLGFEPTELIDAQARLSNCLHRAMPGFGGLVNDLYLAHYDTELCGDLLWGKGTYDALTALTEKAKEGQRAISQTQYTNRRWTFQRPGR